MQFTFADLFAGIGGFHQAFSDLGGKCVFASEWDKYAQETYEANYGMRPDGDIRMIPPEDIPDHNILAAGFPCQPFSLAGVTKNNALGREHGLLHSTQGTLFFDAAIIIEEKRPDAFILENVKHFKSHDQGRTFRTTMAVLEEELGYTVYHKIVDAARVVPQHRERIYMVGFREPLHFDFPELPDREPVLRDILDDDVDEKYTLTSRLWQYLQDYAAKHRAKGNGFGYGLPDPDTEIARTLSARYYKDGSEILIPQEGARPRMLTPRECARLMGFPENFEIPVSDTQAYRQFGNSVVVPVIREIGAAILDALEAKRPASKQQTVAAQKSIFSELEKRERREHLKARDLGQIVDQFRRQGVDRVLAREIQPYRLSSNSILLGSSPRILNQIPVRGFRTGKSKRQIGRQVFKSRLNLAWMNPEGKLIQAPIAQLSLDPKTREIRIFDPVRACVDPPDMEVASQNRSVLLLGIRDDGKIVARLVDARESAATDLLEMLSPHRHALTEFMVDDGGLDAVVRPGSLLENGEGDFSEMSDAEGRLSFSRVLEKAEASLGENLSRWRTDSERLEVCLDPAGGYIREAGVSAFVQKYGQENPRSTTERYDVRTIHQFGEKNESSGLELALIGFDAESREITDVNGGIRLVDSENQLAAEWPLVDLLNYWVERPLHLFKIKTNPEAEHSEKVEWMVEWMEDTDFFRFLDLISRAKVEYQPELMVRYPGSEQETTREKHRFVVSSSSLSDLYHRSGNVLRVKESERGFALA